MIYFYVQLLNAVALAGEGEGHSHGPTEHMGPVVAVFALLVIGGAAFHFFTKKKK